MKKLLIEESHGGRVVHLILNSPDNLNAMDLEMAALFREATDDLKQRSDLRIVVIRGNGRAFSAGGDLLMLRAKAEKSIPQNSVEMLTFYRSFLDLRELGVPLVCALHGHVVGAGFCFAAACDLRIADESVKLSAPFTRLALHPGMGGSYFLPRSLGSEIAREMMLTGRRMGAAEALGEGFLSDVTVVGGLQERLDETLDELLKGAPGATAALLASQRAQEQKAVREALHLEAQQQAECYARDEFLTGINALIEKRDPPWVNP